MLRARPSTRAIRSAMSRRSTFVGPEVQPKIAFMATSVLPAIRAAPNSHKDSKSLLIRNPPCALTVVRKNHGAADSFPARARKRPLFHFRETI